MKKILLSIVLLVVGLILAVELSAILSTILINKTPPTYIDFSLALDYVLANDQPYRKLFYAFFLVSVALVILLLFPKKQTYKSELLKITDAIYIPAPAGECQYGSERFLTSKEKEEVFDSVTINKHDQLIQYLCQHGKDDLLLYEEKERLSAEREKALSIIKQKINAIRSKSNEYVLDIQNFVDDLERDLNNQFNDANDNRAVKRALDFGQQQLEQIKTKEEIAEIKKVYTDKLKQQIEAIMENNKSGNFADISRDLRGSFQRLIGERYFEEDIIAVYSNYSQRVTAAGTKQSKYKEDEEYIREQFHIVQALLTEKELEISSPIQRKGFYELLKKTYQIFDLVYNGQTADVAVQEIKDELNQLFAVKENREENDNDELLCSDMNKTFFEQRKELFKPFFQETPYLSKAGIVLGMRPQKSSGKEKYYCCADDVHTLCIGTTRSGKSRCAVLQSIGVLGLAGESMILTDPKGELFQFTEPYLKRLGYKVIVLDFKNPAKSHHYNFLQPVIYAVDENRIDDAIDAVWDITNAIVPETNTGEKIWTHGEQSIIAACIMIVVWDNRRRIVTDDEGKKQEIGHPEFQNLGNVYYFLSEMVKTYGKIVPLNLYSEHLAEHEPNHPARKLLSIAQVSPDKTRASFYAGALTALRLFTSEYIQDLTSSSDYDPRQIGKEKTALFIVLPDAKTTFYSLASLLVTQHYLALADDADKYHGGRLEKDVNFILDEFGNFAKISDFANKLTVGGGRGMRFHLFIQGISQLEEKYNKEVASIILSNCHNWVYLQANDTQTPETISSKLGSYTVTSYSLSNNVNSGRNGSIGGSSSGSSVNLTGRKLLLPEEITKIARPYSLVLPSKYHPAMMYAPDISNQIFNEIFGMGDKKDNIKLRALREKYRPQRTISAAGAHNWDEADQWVAKAKMLNLRP